MNPSIKFLQTLKHRYQKQTSRYLSSALKKAEFVLYIILYICLTILLIFGPPTSKGIISTLQSFVMFFFAFRFGYMGLLAALFFSIRDFYVLLNLFWDTNGMDYAIGLCSKIFTILSVVIITILTDKKETQQQKLQELAVTDELTGVYNQRFFYKKIDQEIGKAQATGNTVGLIMMDIDDFKEVNDIYGHEYGNKILKKTGDLLRKLSAGKYLVFRYGGDEFMVILPGVDVNTLKDMADYIKKTFETSDWTFVQPDFNNKVTLSMGLSLYPELSANKSELISHADMALYHAKNLGKDNIHFYQDIIKQIRKKISPNHQQLIVAFKTLLSTIAAKDKYTLAHSERVAGYAVTIGESFGLKPEEMSILQYAGILHDIGKVKLPKSILNKTESLTSEESALIQLHPVYSENILEPLEGLGELLNIVRHHHERYDGKGYPDGLRGDEISLGARILCVADSFDAMLSERPYSKSMTPEEALDELVRCQGSQFDPQIVKVFTERMKNKSHKELT